MGFTTFVKTAFDPRSWFGASQTNIQIVGKQVKGQPFNYGNAVKFYNSWIYAAANLNAQAVASTPLRLYVRRRQGMKNLFSTRPVTSRRKAYLLGDDQAQPSVGVMRKIAEFGKDWDEVDDNHPVLQLLQTANPINNGFDLTVLRVVYQELTGNAYLHPVFSEMYQRPAALYPMPSQWVEIEPCEVNFVKGYWYGPTKSQRMFFPRDEVMHFRRPNPNDLYYGIGKLEAAWGAALQNAATHDMDLALYENHARPDMLAIFKGQATPEQLDHFKSIINEELRGTKQRGKFLAVNSDVDLKPMSFPPKDMQGRDQIVEEIAAVFGVPVSMLKANDPNLASATAGYAAWKQGTVLPLCRMDEEALNSLLLPLFGIEDDAVLAYDNPVPADKQFELQRHTAALSGGWMTVNEVRAEQGLDPMPEPVAPPMPVSAPPPPAAAPPMATDAEADSGLNAKNCGTGAGGFKPGNTCAGGGDGGDSSESDSEEDTAASSATTKSNPSGPTRTQSSRKSKVSEETNSTNRWIDFLRQERTRTTSLPS